VSHHWLLSSESEGVAVCFGNYCFVGCLTRVHTDTSACNLSTCPSVETRFQPCSPPACIGTEHRNRNDGAFRQSAPQHAFLPPAGSVHPGTLPVISDEDRKLVTAFRSPVTTAPFGATITGSMFLACYFTSLPHVHAARSDLWLHPVSGLRRKTVVSLPQSRCSAFVRLV